MQVQHNHYPNRKISVYYEGTDTLYEGYALCFNQDYGIAASADGERQFRVEKPSTTNAMHFAGVVAESGNAKTGPCEVEIYLPGSTCNVWAYVNATINTTRLTFCQGQYYFYTQGFPGKGSALARQTLNRGTTAGLLMATLEEGPQSGGVELFNATTLAAAGAIVPSLYGATYFPAATLAADATYTLANGTWLGQKKAFFCEGAMTNNDVVITVGTPQIIAAVATAGYDVCTMDAAAEFLSAEWNGKAWEVQGSVLA
jgi:hypothetical protein